MRNSLWIVAAWLVAMLMAACTQPEPVVVVMTATQTPEERVDNKLARDVASESLTTDVKGCPFVGSPGNWAYTEKQ